MNLSRAIIEQSCFFARLIGLHTSRMVQIVPRSGRHANCGCPLRPRHRFLSSTLAGVVGPHPPDETDESGCAQSALRPYLRTRQQTLDSFRQGVTPFGLGTTVSGEAKLAGAIKHQVSLTFYL